MKIELTKEEGRYIDAKRDLRIISKMRNHLHYLSNGVDLEDYENYLYANEVLIDAENQIWEVIENDDEEQEETLRENLKEIMDKFRITLMKFKDRYSSDEEILSIIDSFDEVFTNLKEVLKK